MPKEVIMLECRKCGNREYTTKKNGPHIGAYCSRCGKWIKWLSPAEKEDTVPTPEEAEFDSQRRKLELDRQIEAENALDDDDDCPF